MQKWSEKLILETLHINTLYNNENLSSFELCMMPYKLPNSCDSFCSFLFLGAVWTIQVLPEFIFPHHGLLPVYSRNPNWLPIHILGTIGKYQVDRNFSSAKFKARYVFKIFKHLSQRQKVSYCDRSSFIVHFPSSINFF